MRVTTEVHVCPCNTAKALLSTVNFSKKARYRGYQDKAQLLENYVIHELKKTNVSRPNFYEKKRERETAGGACFLLFPTFLLFLIHCFLHTLLPSPRDKLEF